MLGVYLALQAVVLLINSFIWAFLPDYNFDLYSITVDSVIGVSMLKSDIGGSLMTLSLFTTLFLIKGKQWYYPMMFFMGYLLLVKTVSLITDGYHQVAIFWVVMKALFLFAAYTLNPMQNSNAE